MNTAKTLMLGGLFGLTAALAGCGSLYGSTPPAPASDPVATVTITITGMNGSLSFSPNPATVKVGQTVAWYNADSLAHNPAGENGAFGVEKLVHGATSRPITLSEAGAFTYRCALHPTMVGTLTVTP